jgi:lysophospholipase L1-like esterase
VLQRFAVPVEEFTANLVALVKKLRKAGVANVLLLTPPPVNDKVGAGGSTGGGWVGGWV